MVGLCGCGKLEGQSPFQDKASWFKSTPAGLYKKINTFTFNKVLSV